MAKESGLGITTLSVDDSAGTPRDIRADVNTFQLGTPQNLLVVTGVDKLAEERLVGMGDGMFQLNGTFDDGANLAHAVFKNIGTNPATGRTTSINISGQTLAMEMFYEDYSLNRGADGSLTWQTTGRLADGTKPAWS